MASYYCEQPVGTRLRQLNDDHTASVSPESEVILQVKVSACTQLTGYVNLPKGHTELSLSRLAAQLLRDHLNGEK